MTTGNIIFCCDNNYGIGKNNALPWEYPLDMKWFKAATDGLPCVGGRNTWDSIGSPLSGRESNIISSSSPEKEGFKVWRTLDEYLEYINGYHYFAIGGPKIWDELLEKEQIGRIYQTKLKSEYSADIHLSEYMKNKIQEGFTEIFSYENDDAIFSILELTSEVNFNPPIDYSDGSDVEHVAFWG